MPIWEGLICDACGDHVIDLEEAVIWQEDQSMICPDAALARIRVRLTGRCTCGEKCRLEVGDAAHRCIRCLGAVRWWSNPSRRAKAPGPAGWGRRGGRCRDGRRLPPAEAGLDLRPCSWVPI